MSQPDAIHTGMESGEYRTITVDIAPGPGGDPYDSDRTPDMFVRTVGGISMVPAEAHADALYKAWKDAKKSEMP